MSKLLSRSASGESTSSVTFQQSTMRRILRRSCSKESASSVICSSCSDDFEARRCEEKEFAARHDSEKSSVWYIVDIHWLESWRHFVNGRAGPPGPIDNTRLVTRESVETLREPVKDYRAVNDAMWNFFEQVYGGGPVLRRRTVNLYSHPAQDPGEDANHLFAPPPSPEKRRKSNLSPLLEVAQEGVAEVPLEGALEATHENKSSDPAIRSLNFQSKESDLIVRSLCLTSFGGASVCRDGGA